MRVFARKKKSNGWADFVIFVYSKEELIKAVGKYQKANIMVDGDFHDGARAYARNFGVNCYTLKSREFDIESMLRDDSYQEVTWVSSDIV